MIIIDIVKAKQEGKTELPFSFGYSASEDLITLPGATFDGDVCVNGIAQLCNTDVYCDITVSYRLKGECSRCLDAAFSDVSYAFSATFVLHPTGAEDEYLYKSGKVDLTAAVNEAVLISQPTVIYCKPDCRG